MVEQWWGITVTLLEPDLEEKEEDKRRSIFTCAQNHIVYIGHIPHADVVYYISWIDAQCPPLCVCVMWSSSVCVCVLWSFSENWLHWDISCVERYTVLLPSWKARQLILTLSHRAFVHTYVYMSVTISYGNLTHGLKIVFIAIPTPSCCFIYLYNNLNFYLDCFQFFAALVAIRSATNWGQPVCHFLPPVHILIPLVHKNAGQNGISYPKREPGYLAFRGNQERSNAISVGCINYIVPNVSYTYLYIILLSSEAICVILWYIL